MANNRLILYNSETKEHLVLAKDFGNGWQLGNVDLLQEFLGSFIEQSEKTVLVIGTENDQLFNDKYLEESTNANTENIWHPYQPMQ